MQGEHPLGPWRLLETSATAVMGRSLCQGKAQARSDSASLVVDQWLWAISWVDTAHLCELASLGRFAQSHHRAAGSSLDLDAAQCPFRAPPVWVPLLCGA